jgi:nucleoside-diphosphate-sugar epimerase
MNKNLLILGASGFFGKSILEYLYQKKSFYKKQFETITVLSRKARGNTSILKKLKKHFKIIFLKQDILKVKKLPSAQSIIYCMLLDDIKKDYLAVRRFSKILQKSECKPNIVFTSSGAVYGNKLEKEKAVKESLNLNKIFLFLDLKKRQYAYYKLKSEKIFEKLSKNGFKISILRCFAFVGENLPRNKNFVIGDFINKILNSKTIIAKSKHKTTRSYMHQEDLAAWILKILLKSNKKFSVYNVGSNDPVTIHQLGLALSKKYKVKFKSNLESSKFNDYYLPNIEKVKKTFGLKLKYNSMQAIMKTIEDIKKKKIVLFSNQ